ncbi:MAG: phosphoribosylformylglycinamidine synthase, partial [Oscillospiraceae bacterium]|nr:phosphoribosylformylglycinamidine synthase [Oscillospiraceae bacterium]
MAVYRIYTEKKPQFAVEAQSVLADLRTALRLDVMGVRVLNRYDADHIEAEDFQRAIPTVFSEPAVDYVYEKLPLLSNGERVFAVEYLPGQFDQRADSCEQCIQILNGKERCRVRNARIYIISGTVSDKEFARLKSYLINPVESREASLEPVASLDTNYAIPETVETLDGFCKLDAKGRAQFLKQYGLAMDLDDVAFCQSYFRDTEHRDPTITEIRMIDTYWSDHCRHTTFLTSIDRVKITTPYIQDAYDDYLRIRKELGREKKPVTLMDMATMAMRKLKADGRIPALDESEEINACSVKIKIDTDHGQEDWILMFKNETHNHPTEIEPFGGAATCLGGAIRDPLSGRSYVYQAMRVTGAGNPLTPVADTIPG